MEYKELKERQSWPLAQKIDHALGTIDQFLSRTNNQAYVSFSGGLNSTVMLDLVKIVKPDIKSVFFNTGMEYPDIIRFIHELIRGGKISRSYLQPCLRVKYGKPMDFH